jgi:hypothetical protein
VTRPVVGAYDVGTHETFCPIHDRLRAKSAET